MTKESPRFPQRASRARAGSASVTSVPHTIYINKQCHTDILHNTCLTQTRPQELSIISYTSKVRNYMINIWKLIEVNLKPSCMVLGKLLNHCDLLSPQSKGDNASFASQVRWSVEHLAHRRPSKYWFLHLPRSTAGSSRGGANVRPRAGLVSKPRAFPLLMPILPWTSRALTLWSKPVPSFPCHFLGSNSNLLGSSFLPKRMSVIKATSHR